MKLILSTLCLLSVFAKNHPVYLALKQYNTDILKSKLESISDPLSDEYGKFMTREEINNLVRPEILNTSNTLNYFSKFSLDNFINYGDSIYFEASSETLEQMFKIQDTKNIRGYTIPEEISHDVDFLEMSSNYRKKKSKINIKSSSNKVDDRYFGRESLVRLYNVTRPSVIHHGSAGAIEYQNNGGFTQDDVTNQQSDNGQNPQEVGNIVGPNFGTDGESELDVQMISQAGDGVISWFWDVPYWLYSFSVDFYNSEDRPDIISMSWGWAEDSQCDIVDCSNLTSQQYVERVNNEFVKLGLIGTTITVSSGDAGAPGRTSETCDPDRPVNPVFPGSSPYVLSIGATYVSLDNNTYNYTSKLCENHSCVEGNDEHVISNDNVGWTSGGGFSIYTNSTPKWQETNVDKYLNSGVKLPSKFNKNGRAYPDISAVGHSCPTYLAGELMPIDGTSCSSPLVAGLLAIVNDHLWEKKGTKLGFVNPLIYHLSNNCKNCFNDINDGHNWCTEETCCNSTNFGFQGADGYDPVTGLGTLNLGNILDFI